MDITKISEADNFVENEKKVKDRLEEIQKRKEENEATREPDGFELALNRVLGRSSDDLIKETKRGILSGDVKIVCNHILKNINRIPDRMKSSSKGKINGDSRSI